jgi:GT2 family glycosyltransferase
MDEGSEASPRVLAVVVCHNGEPWVKECFEGLASQVYPALDVIVVDNGSARPIEKLARRILPGAEFMRLDTNVGFAAAANLALEASEKAPSGDYYLFLHDDVALESECISLLIAAAMETGAGVVGGKGLAWDNPELLVEVGMTADQFGYPFAGLEEGEIDQGQHDQRREVLFVTSACILVGRALVEKVGSWDTGYFAFGEDLDLCTRARLSGFKVIVQPAACFRHAIALAHSMRKASNLQSIRFLTRRNRLRTIAKNAAGYRLLPLTLLYVALGFAEIAALAALGRFEEIPEYPKAAWSLLKSLPDVARRRRAVQKRRAIADRRIRRFMVRDIHRARVFAERRFQDWEKDTVSFGARVAAKLSPAALRVWISARVRRPITIANTALAVVLAFALHRVLTGPPVGAGGMWPFPDHATRLLSQFFAGWRNAGLGTKSAAPPAFLLLWAAQVVSLGKARLAQALLVALLLGGGLVGMNRFVARRTGFWPARFFALVLYALGPVVRLMAGAADVGAMALFAAAPFMLEIALRMLGPTPGAEGDRAAAPHTTRALTRETAKLGLLIAVVVALSPSALVAVAAGLVALGLAAVPAAWDRRESARRLGWVLASIGVALLVLVPWSIEALRPAGAALGPLFAGRGGGPSYGVLWSARSAADFLLLHPGSGRPGLAVVLAVAVGALAVAPASKRREARALAAVWIIFSVLGGLVAKSLMPAPAASPAIWMALPLAALAAMGGHFVAGFHEELPRHALGARHVAATALLVIAGVGMAGSWGPELGKWPRPASTLAADTDKFAHSLSSYFTSTAEQTGDFRILWLGRTWVDPVAPGYRRFDGAPYLLTGQGGLTMLDAFEPPPAAGRRALDEAVDATVERRLHLAGHLLAPAGIRYIVADPNDTALMTALRLQRDIALEQQQQGVAIFRNVMWVPRASLVSAGPGGLAGPADAASPSGRSLLLTDWTPGPELRSRPGGGFIGRTGGRPYRLVLLGDNFNPGWKARAGRLALDHSRAFGWANKYLLPPGVSSEIQISYTGGWVRILWVALEALIVFIAVAIIRGSREIRGWLR